MLCNKFYLQDTYYFITLKPLSDPQSNPYTVRENHLHPTNRRQDSRVKYI